MAGFSLLRSESTEQDLELDISSLTLSIGDIIELDVGATTWTVGDSATEHWQLKAICMESATSSDTVVKARLVSPGQLWEAESANNSDSTHNGDRMILTDQNTVNNTGTDDASEEAVFLQLGTIGAVADKRIFGLVVPGTGVNSDAS